MYEKITTFTFGGITSVSIARFECTKDIILNILNLFEYKNAVIEIGCIEKTSVLFQIIKHLALSIQCRRGKIHYIRILFLR